MNRLLIGLAILALCAGCVRRAETVEQVNAEYKVDTLFSKDGCTVYRFHDGGYRYFTNCVGSTEWRVSCGKNCTRTIEVTGGKRESDDN
jgi:hypothetical protein